MSIKITLILISLTTAYLAGYVKGKKGCEQKNLIEKQTQELEAQKQQIIYRDKLVYVKKIQENIHAPSDLEERRKLWNAINSL